MEFTDFATPKMDASGQISHASDASLFVEFYEESVRNGGKSEAAGRPIHDDVIYIRIVIPGGKTTVERVARDEDKIRFPRQWAAFQANAKEPAVMGTPLKEWPALSKAQVADFVSVGIKTVDQLAALNDHGIQAIGMGGREWKAKAQAFLAQAAGNAPLETLAAENERMAEELEQYQQTVKVMAAQTAELETRLRALESRTAMQISTQTFQAKGEYKYTPAVGMQMVTVQPIAHALTEPLHDKPAEPVLAERRRGRPKKNAA